jgi:hypothetical protein
MESQLRASSVSNSSRCSSESSVGHIDQEHLDVLSGQFWKTLIWCAAIQAN